MRYKPDHKATARRKILDAAATLFRRHGYDGVGIDALMAEAGLTRGGFYAHFASKRDLFAAVMARDGDFNRRMHARKGVTDEELLNDTLDVVRGYLGAENLPNVAAGCQMAALSLDTARADQPARRAYDTQLRDLQHEFTRGMTGDAEETAQRALVAIAQCVGAVVIANACDNPNLKSDTLTAALEAVTKNLTGN